MNSKTLIMDAMITLVEEGTFDSITINNIVTQTGITRGGFYYHFQSKYQLSEEIFKRDMGPIDLSDTARLYETAFRGLTNIKSRQKYYFKMFKNLDFRTFLYYYFEELINEWIDKKNKLISVTEDEKTFIIRSINYLIVPMLIKWAYLNFDEEPEVLLHNYKVFLTNFNDLIQP